MNINIGLSFLALILATNYAEAKVEVINYDYEWPLLELPGSDYHVYIEFTHPKGSFNINLPKVNHKAILENAPVEGYSSINVKKGLGYNASKKGYKTIAKCDLPYSKYGNKLTVNVHFADKKTICNVVKGADSETLEQ